MKKKRSIVALSLAAFFLLASVTVSLAWFARLHSADINKSGGSLVTNYFHQGDGTAEHPYEITRPVHFYNLVMLYQANPSFKEGSDFITASAHFRIGTKDLDLDGVDELDEFSVFEYDDLGETDDKTASKTLNLASYGDGLFPIGSAEKPFQATLDGNNITLKNLKIIGSATLNGTECKTPDIGLFGYVSNGSSETDQPATIKNIYVEDMTIDLTNVDITGEHSTSTTSKTHNTHTDNKAYVGYIAGHIITGAQVNDVYVNNCTIIGGNEATTGFGFFGHVEDENGVSVTTLGAEIATQRTKGDEAGFGGSVDMKQMQERLQQVFSSGTTPSTYYSVENIVINENDGTRTVTESSPKNITYNNTSYKYKYYSTPYSGSYYFWQRDDMRNYQFMCLYGETSLNKKTTNTYTITAEDLTAFYISDGSRYLAAAAGNVTATEDRNAASKWSFDESGHLFTYADNEIYYLNRSEITDITVTQTAETVWQRDTQNSTLYTVIDGTNYYLDYLGKWTLSSLVSYSYISDNAGHYLSATNNAAITTASLASESVKWQVDINGSEYTVRTEINGKFYYLVFDGTLKLSETSDTWTMQDGYLTKTLGSGSTSITYKFIYDNGFKAVAPGKLITDGAGNYLSCNTTQIVNTDNGTTASVVWQTVTDGSGTQFYTYLGNNTPYYLSFDASNGLTVSQVPFSWEKSGNSYYCINSGKTYYIRYNNEWEAVQLEYTLIRSGTHYLKATGENTFTDTTAEADATRFYFSDNENHSGTVYYYANDTKYYLGVSNSGTFANTATSWSVTGSGYLRAGTTDYYLVYDTGESKWKILDNSLKYTISYNGNYLNINSSGNSYENGTDADTATRWKFSNTSTTPPSGTISTVTADGTTKYLTATRWSSLSISNSSANWSVQSNRLLCNNRYLTYSTGWFSSGQWTTTNRSNNAVALTYTAIQDTPSAVTLDYHTDQTPEITVVDITVPAANITISDPVTADYSLTFEETTQKKIAKETQTNIPGGYATYFPLRIAGSEENGWYDASDPFKVSQKNTGYIISGARIQDSTTADSGQKAAGDIRISYFPISSINSSYSSLNNQFSTIYTVDDSGDHSYTANSSVFQEASAQLLETLNGSSSVYGLHFMDAEISKDYLVTAEKAVILGKEYNNYELPMDSIDFNVVERGAISFFAGSYFTSNDTFFSLHQVFRDKNNKITAIREIAEIYEDSTYHNLKPYIYRFSDGTYSNADGNYTGATSLASGYESVFKTEWITNPGISEDNKIYFFEIPCNKGEYCLGSVSGKTGAYLIYLDIATNGGDTISKIISSEGNDVTNAFRAEYRTTPDKLGENNYSVLLFSTTAPQGTNADSFSVNVSFEKPSDTDPNYQDYRNGIYTITVNNKSGEDIRLDVYLCDDDRDSTNDFLYAYKVVYNNTTQTGATVKTVLDTDYWQAMASFSIPSSGDATELAYTE